jgi:hypothetical protein
MARRAGCASWHLLLIFHPLDSLPSASAPVRLLAFFDQRIAFRLIQITTTDYQAITNSYMINDVACRVHVAYIQGAMETSLPRRAEDYAADSAPAQARQNAAASPKRDRRRLLTKLDKRGRVGKRVARLVELFEGAFHPGALTPWKREEIATAAQLAGYGRGRARPVDEGGEQGKPRRSG